MCVKQDISCLVLTLQTSAQHAERGRGEEESGERGVLEARLTGIRREKTGLKGKRGSVCCFKTSRGGRGRKGVNRVKGEL